MDLRGPEGSLGVQGLHDTNGQRNQVRVLSNDWQGVLCPVSFGLHKSTTEAAEKVTTQF